MAHFFKNQKEYYSLNATITNIRPLYTMKDVNGEMKRTEDPSKRILTFTHDIGGELVEESAVVFKEVVEGLPVNLFNGINAKLTCLDNKYVDKVTGEEKDGTNVYAIAVDYDSIKDPIVKLKMLGVSVNIGLIW